MKRYTLSYDHVAGKRTRDTTSLLELTLFIEEAMEDRYVLQHTIEIQTTDINREGDVHPLISEI